MKIKYITTVILIFLVSLMLSCEKEITVDLPEAEAKLVVEGRIEPGLPPFVMLTRSAGYFDATDVSSFENNFVHNAVVKVFDGTTEVTLEEYCANTLPPVLLPFVAEITGIPVENLNRVNYCIYATFNTAIWGQTGKTYYLTINSEEKTYSSTTLIPVPVPLDSLWFEAERDSLGFVWARLSEPPGPVNAYRWYAMRLGKDASFIAPFGSAFDDKFVDGKTFNFGYQRGAVANSNASDDNNSERAYFKTGDTIVVKFCSIDKGTFEFLRGYETEVINNSNPFASPTTIKSNIEGGALGYWGGYGAAYDTLVAVK